MPTQIQFRKGNMLSFMATRNFALGQNGGNIIKGQELFFDGSSVDVGDGNAMSMPQLRGAVKNGWIVLSEEFDETDNSSEIPRTANIQVRHPTQGGNPMRPTPVARTTMATADEEEREVGQIQAHASQTRTANNNYRRGDVVNPRAPIEVEDQDGIPVRALKTPAGDRAKQMRTVLTANSAGQAIREAEHVTIDPGRGITEGEMLDRMGEEERQAYLNKKDALRSQYVDEPPVVARIPKKSSSSETREGITASVSTGRGVGITDLSGSDRKPTQRTFEEDGIQFTTTNGPKPQDLSNSTAESQQPVMVRDGTVEVRRQVARQLCPDFPENYDFGAAPKKKLARLQADYEDRPDVLKAVFAAETDAFKAVLVREFPDQFQA